jgi:hypothetical protein
MSSPDDATRAIDSPYDLTPDHVRRFREDGFIKLKDTFDGPTLDHYGQAITRLTLENAPQKKLEERDTYGKAFIQVGNLWERDETAKAFGFGKRLARIATELMGCAGVRMYHDQSLYKEPAGGFTPWHVDQQYWPFSTGNTVTAWVPLQAVPIDMGPLEFGGAATSRTSAVTWRSATKASVSSASRSSRKAF